MLVGSFSVLATVFMPHTANSVGLVFASPMWLISTALVDLTLTCALTYYLWKVVHPSLPSRSSADQYAQRRSDFKNNNSMVDMLIRSQCIQCMRGSLTHTRFSDRPKWFLDHCSCHSGPELSGGISVTLALCVIWATSGYASHSHSASRLVLDASTIYHCRHLVPQCSPCRAGRRWRHQGKY
jgi:hypothetical protein